MKLVKSASKLERYYERLNKGKAAKIKLDHVKRVLRKLKSKREKVAHERETAETKRQKDRFKRKLAVIDDQIERAKWLLGEIGTEGN